MIYVPEDLKAYKQWVSYKLEAKPGTIKLTKVPYNPVFSYGASSVDPSTWMDHDTVMTVNTHLFSGPGFVLSKDDPFTFIDLDSPFVREDGSDITEETPDEWAAAQSVWASHLQIVHHLDSYTEWSPSGKGLHIILKGQLPETAGNRIGKVEVYSHSRFMTMTGNIYNGSALQINERQGALDVLVERLGLSGKGGVISHESQAETRNDAAVVNAAMSGKTADLFNRLWAGDITGYPSGSEADLAFANLICFQTDNTEQATRIFLASPYYAMRPKLHSRADLISRAIQKGMDQKAAPIDVEAMRASAAAMASLVAGDAPQVAPTDPLLMTKPEGLLGDIAQYLYDVSPRPVREVALAGAIGLLAGITGRAYNVSGTGLNQYVVLLGASGIGKESISSGISKLMRYIVDTHPSAEHFIGPSHIASATALYSQFGDGKNPGKSPSFVSILGEFGKWLAVHTQQNANANYEMLVRGFLELWAKSGRGNTVGRTVYADKAKELNVIEAPAFSFVGESVPARFYSACTADAIEGGLIPRFLIVEYLGERPPLNKTAFDVRPSINFISNMKAVCERSLGLNHSNNPIDVTFMPQAEAFLDEFDRFCDYQINRSPHDTVKAIWNRSHLKALKLAALISVGKNWLNPVVELHHAQWAKAFVVADAHKMLSRFELGEISSGSIDNDKHRCILQFIRKYVERPTLPSSYKIKTAAHKLGLIPLRHITNNLLERKCFKQPGRTAQDHMKKAIAELIEQGILIEHKKGVSGVLAEAGEGDSRCDWYSVIDPTVFERIKDS